MPNPLLRDRQLDTDVQRPNLLQNGGFEVWPGSGSQAGVVGSQARVADGSWFVLTGTGGAITFTRQAGNNSPYAAGVSYIHGSVATQLVQSIPVFAQLVGRQVTFAVDVFANTGNTTRVLIWDGVGPLQYSAYHPGGSVWQRMSSTCTVASNATQLWVYVEFANSMGGAIDNATVVLGGTPGDFAPSISYPDAIPSARLGTDVARANLLTNGGFEVWQRGNGPFTGSLCADAWRIGTVGTDTLSVSRANAASLGYGNNAACTFTLGTGAGGTQIFQQLNLLGDGPNLQGLTVTFSMRVMTSTANAVRIGINNLYASTSHWTYSAFHPGGGTWQTLTVTATIDPAATYIQVAPFFAASCTANIDNAMLVVGSVPADYVPLHPTDDLARCQRYYETYPTEAWLGAGAHISAVNAEYVVQYMATKAVNPTVTIGVPTNLRIRDGSAEIQVTAIDFIGQGLTRMLVQPRGVGLTLGRGSTFHQVGDAKIAVEANP